MKPPEIRPDVFADSARQLLAERPERYKLFGVWWYYVKALLKRQYSRDELPMLGDFEQPEVLALMPELDAQESLAAAIATYQDNAYYGLGRTDQVTADGEPFNLYDEDVGL